MHISERVNQQLLKRIMESAGHLTAPPLEILTNRELEIFQLIGQGLTNQQIAEKIYISPKTVHAHKNHITTKLGLKNSSELAQEALFYHQNHTSQ